jgi:hypothetical protein
MANQYNGVSAASNRRSTMAKIEEKGGIGSAKTQAKIMAWRQ